MLHETGVLQPLPTAAPVRGVCLDCDGVLVDSESLSASILTAMLGEQGIEFGVAEALTLLRGRQVATWVAELFAALPLAGSPEAFVPDYRARVSAAYRRELRPEPHAQELLDRIEVPYSIVSNAPGWKISEGLDCAGLDASSASSYVSAYDLQSWKPEPTVYLEAAAGLGVPAEHCIAVEDSDAGIRAAHAAGMRVLHYAREEAIPTHPMAVARSRNHRQTRLLLTTLATQGAAV
jgi:HAD superfamily hydrolase (TIGR01509 family)